MLRRQDGEEEIIPGFEFEDYDADGIGQRASRASSMSALRRGRL